MRSRKRKCLVRSIQGICVGLGVWVTNVVPAHANLTGTIDSVTPTVQTTPYRKVDVVVDWTVTNTGIETTTELTSVFTGQTGKVKDTIVGANLIVSDTLPYTVFPTAGTYDINSRLFEKAYTTNVLATDTTPCTVP